VTTTDAVGLSRRRVNCSVHLPATLHGPHVHSKHCEQTLHTLQTLQTLHTEHVLHTVHTATTHGDAHGDTMHGETAHGDGAHGDGTGAAQTDRPLAPPSDSVSCWTAFSRSVTRTSSGFGASGWPGSSDMALLAGGRRRRYAGIRGLVKDARIMATCRA
jgi:hypothetical protein